MTSRTRRTAAVAVGQCVREAHAQSPDSNIQVLTDGSLSTFSTSFSYRIFVCCQMFHPSLSALLPPPLCIPSYPFFPLSSLCLSRPLPLRSYSKHLSSSSSPLPFGGSSVPVRGFICVIYILSDSLLCPPPLLQPLGFLLQPDHRKAAALCDERERRR